MFRKLILLALMVSVPVFAKPAEGLLDSEKKIIESYVSLVEEVSSHFEKIKDMKSAKAAFEKINKLQSKVDLILKSEKKLKLNIDFGGLDDKKNKDDVTRNRMIKCQQKVIKVIMKAQKDKELLKFLEENMENLFAGFDD